MSVTLHFRDGSDSRVCREDFDEADRMFSSALFGQRRTFVFTNPDGTPALFVTQSIKCIEGRKP